MPPAVIFEHLTFARRIADHADRLGVHRLPVAPRIASDHLGAVLADSILQAGVSYRTVVRMRIERIQSQYPETATLPELIALIERDGAGDFLLWNHPTKVARFISLAQFLRMQDIETTIDLKHWLYRNSAREHLIAIQGIGPKTCDYLCCLVGLDCIAVDRHIKTFVQEAGVTVSGYDDLKSVVSYAADLLGITRRDFDAWIWRTTSARTVSHDQPSLI